MPQVRMRGDVRVCAAAVLLLLGLICSVLAVSTVHWYEYKFQMNFGESFSSGYKGFAMGKGEWLARSGGADDLGRT